MSPQYHTVEYIDLSHYQPAFLSARVARAVRAVRERVAGAHCPRHARYTCILRPIISTLITDTGSGSS